MYRGNFRILIFIDLLATALGGSIILMLILSVNKSRSAAPAGTARDFIYYKAYALNNPQAHFKVIVKSGDTKEWLESLFSENAAATPGAWLNTPGKTGLYTWGPVNEYDTSGNLKQANVYNVYSAVKKSGEWVIGLLYYNDSDIEPGDPQSINKLIQVVHEVRLPDTTLRDTQSVSLGNYSHIKFLVEPKL